MKIEILYEDKDIVAANKPSGLPCHVTRDPERPHLIGELERQLSRAANSLILAHRLDAGTSGIILLAKNRAAGEELSRQFREREPEKIYLAVIEFDRQPPAPDWSVVNHLSEDKKGKMREVRAGGARAETGFRLLDSRGRLALIEARPRTGRKHQIRVHLAGCGFPIVGDYIYGSSGRVEERLLLHASCLRFRLPSSQQEKLIVAPTPPGFSLAMLARER